MRRSWLCLLLVAELGAQGSAANAAPSRKQPRKSARSPDEAEAKRLFELGVTQADRGQWREAVELFAASRRLVARPKTIFNLGKALVEVGDPIQAAAAFREILRLPAADTSPELLERTAASLDDAHAAIATLELEIIPPETSVHIDGSLDPSTGKLRRLQLNPGVRHVEAQCPGYEPASMELTLARGAFERRQLHLARTSAVPPTAGLGGSSPELAGGSNSVLSSPWLWVAIGVAGLAAGGVAIGVAAGSQPPPYGGTVGLTF